LYGIAQDGMTIRWLGKLNRYHVPANAMTVDAVLNIVLLFTYASDPIGALKILVFSNLGYVLCHCFATSGFLMLRRDRPAWPRPIKVGAVWVAICGVLFLFDLLLLIVGAANVGLAYGASTRSTLIPSLLILAIALGLYIFRVVVQDKKPLQLRLPAATVPEEEAALGAPTTTA
jgi:amino acid transporter